MLLMPQTDNIEKVLKPYNCSDTYVYTSLDTFEMYKDDDGDGQKYLRLIYNCETKDHNKYIVEFPKVELPIYTNRLPEFIYPRGECYNYIRLVCHDMDVLYGNTTIMPKSCSTLVASYTDQIKEMTVAEIEKVLGYKIKVISEKDKK